MLCLGRVTVFLMATEDSSQACKLTTAKQAPAPGVFYVQGVS